MVIGWYRDVQCEPPDWNVRPIPAGQIVTISVPGSSANWQVDFIDTRNGTTVLSSASVTRQAGKVTVNLPAFQDDIAFKMTAVGGTVFTPMPNAINTDAIAGHWSGIISSQDSTFSTPLELSIQAGCGLNQVCGAFSAPQLPCSGGLFLQAIDAGAFVFLEQSIAGADFCVTGGVERLTLQTDGTLSYEYSPSLSAPVSSTGNLRRP